MAQPTETNSMTCCFRLLPALVLLGLCGRGLAQGGRPSPVRAVINEILAANRGFLRDPQGQYDDWVELYNPAGVAVDVGGCYLTDDLSRPTKWQIPAGNPTATTIAAGGFLLIWADGDIADPGLHAGFRLDDDGEEVGLFAADGTTLIDSFSFGKQREDISYGRYPDGGSDLRFMAIPTPGAPNLSIYEGITEDPQISVTSQLCTRPVTVTLTTATEGAMIFYTINGSSPYSAARDIPNGLLYSAPIYVTQTLTLKAVAWKPGWRQSDVSVERYIFLGPDVRTFTSPLAIAVVDTMGKGVSGTPTPAYGFFVEVDENARAAMIGETNWGGAAALNIRGKSSAGFPKNQYHFETRDERGDDKDVSILGLPAESDWVLQGPYSDKSLMRNVLAYRWSNEIGRYAPRTRFIEMFLNRDDSLVAMSDYVGVYVFMERIKIGPDRVDIAEIEPSDNTEPEISGGYIVKKDKFDSDDHRFLTSRGQTLIYYDPNGPKLTQQQKDWVRGFFNAFESALYGPNFRDPVNGYANFIDADSFIDLHILVELTKNIDGFRLSTYMFKDRNGKLNMGPAWDYNLSLGNADYLDGWNATGWYYRLLGNDDYPYWRRLFEDPEFTLRYADRWFALRRDLFTTPRLVGMVEEYATLLDEPAARNFDRWRILGKWVWPNWYIAGTFREEIAWMQKWLADRLTWMDSQIAAELAPAPPVFSRQGGYVQRGFELAMSSPGPIYYSTDGSDPRASGGPIVPTVGTVLAAENAPKRVLVPTGPIDEAWRGGGAFDDSAWTLVTGSPGGVGYERASGYEAFISLDTGAQMDNLRTGCYLRIPFVFTRINNVSSLILKVRYDDGFVAYLNGVEIARRNVGGEPAWDSAASNQNPDTSAVNPESIEVIDYRAALRRGDNVLAVHAMNVSTTSSDFLISVELTANELPEVQGPVPVNQYTAPMALTASAWVRARAQVGGRWSALNEAVFAVGPVAESLRISEIMYHPAKTGDPNDPNTEYIELTNIGAEAIDLSLVRFTDGIDFTFPSFELPVGGYCLVVRDVAAFESKYGLDLPLAGQYGGALSNGGERLELQDAGGRVIHSFEFQDSWYSRTDGQGYSLTVKDPRTADPNSLGDRVAWRPSTDPGGSPGAPDSP